MTRRCHRVPAALGTSRAPRGCGGTGRLIVPHAHGPAGRPHARAPRRGVPRRRHAAARPGAGRDARDARGAGDQRRDRRRGRRRGRAGADGGDERRRDPAAGLRRRAAGGGVQRRELPADRARRAGRGGPLARGHVLPERRPPPDADGHRRRRRDRRGRPAGCCRWRRGAGGDAADRYAAGGRLRAVRGRRRWAGADRAAGQPRLRLRPPRAADGRHDDQRPADPRRAGAGHGRRPRLRLQRPRAHRPAGPRQRAAATAAHPQRPEADDQGPGPAGEARQPRRRGDGYAH